MTYRRTPATHFMNVVVLTGVIICLFLSNAACQSNEPNAEDFVPLGTVVGEHKATPIPDFLDTHGISHLAGNLLFIAHWDTDSQTWFVYDVTGNFNPDQMEQPPDADVPDSPEIGMLTKLESGKVYDFKMRRDQIVNLREGEIGDYFFSAGSNFIKWP